MATFVLRRLLSLIPVLVGISLIVFLFLHLIPGDPARAMLGETASEDVVLQTRASLGLDQPLYLQYAHYVGRLLHGDLGQSLRTRNPVSAELASRLPASIELMLAAMAIALAVGLSLGITSAVRRGSWLDTAAVVLGLVGAALPVYVLGLLAAWVFAVQLGWLPPGGRLGTDTHLQSVTGFLVLDGILTRNWPALADALKHLAIPATVLGLGPAALLARTTRASLVEALGQDFVRTARGKGLPDRMVVGRHALRNALLPMLTVFGLQVGIVLGSAVLTETIFSWPGIGRWIFDAIQTRDYPVVQSMTLVIGVVFVLSNLVVDLTYGWLDPRIRYG